MTAQIKDLPESVCYKKMTNIKEEVLKEIEKKKGVNWNRIDFSNEAIDLTKQKMIEQEKRLLNKINEIFNNKEQSFTDASLRVWTIVQNRLEELKKEVEKAK